MPFTPSAARKLLTAPEYELFEASRAEAVKALSAQRLRGKIGRARRLRDKYRALLRDQKLATRRRTGSKSGRTGMANARTEQKQLLFDEVLKRFETRLHRVEAEAARAARNEARREAGKRLAKKRAGEAARSDARRRDVSPKAPAKAPRTAKAGRPGATSESARAANRAMQLQASRNRPIQAHLRAAGRRAQARRDRRG